MTLKPDEDAGKEMFDHNMTIKNMQVKISDDGEIEMSKEEMLQYIET